MTTGNDGREEICQTCQNTKAWHEENNPKHPFNLGDVPVSVTFGRRSDRDTPDGRKPSQRGPEDPSTPAPVPAWPFDPVLRQALIDKNVLTPEDLRAAEKKIIQVTSIFEGRTDGGESAESTRRGEVQK